MDVHDLNLDHTDLVLIGLAHTPTTLVIRLAATAATATCPRCGVPSGRVYSRYTRTVADLPAHERLVILRHRVRRFRCTTPDCPGVIFCERLPDLVVARSRTTDRLTGIHRALGLALGGEAGARLADQLDIPTSPDTLLRRVKDSDGDVPPPPRVVGIDDWAWRKGQRYGTIVVDLERGRVIDLLPDRAAEAVKAWLAAHPGVELIVSVPRTTPWGMGLGSGHPGACGVTGVGREGAREREVGVRTAGRAARVRGWSRPSRRRAGMAPVRWPA